VRRAADAGRGGVATEIPTFQLLFKNISNQHNQSNILIGGGTCVSSCLKTDQSEEYFSSFIATNLFQVYINTFA
jgi:hypothetical protein